MQTFNLAVDRWAPFVRVFAFVGYDFTGATYKMQVRQTKDVGSALLTLNTVSTDIQGVRTSYAGTDTIANHLAAGRFDQADVDTLLDTENPATGVNYELTDSILLSLVEIRIDKANVSTLPLNNGADILFYYDLHITPSGGDETNFVGGQFLVCAGATQ
jgi:hypothetical protein